MKKSLLILERSLAETTLVDKKDGQYILEGIFSEIGVRNKNQRIYDEHEFIPHVEELAKLVPSKKVLGELDHPKQFETSLKNASHVIESLTYDPATKKVMGRIRLLNTTAGKEAQALVDAGIPMHISSRAAGVVEGNGHVKIKKLFTYDLVADPGFENAELNRVNESFGLENDSNIQIFEMSDDIYFNDEQEKQNSIMPENNISESKNESFVSLQDFKNYTDHVKSVFEGFKNEISKIRETALNLNEKGDLSEYLNKITEKFNEFEETIVEIKENQDNLISHNDHIIDGLEQFKNYTKSIEEKTDLLIDYTENHIAENVDKSIEYVKHIREGLVEEFTKQQELNESLSGYLDYLTENQENVANYNEYIKENMEVIGTKLEQLNESTIQTITIEPIVEKTSTVENTEEQTKENNIVEEKPILAESNQVFESNISSTISNLIESAKKQKAVEETGNHNFLNFISEEKRNQFNSLEKEKQVQIVEAFNNTKWIGSSAAEMIYESVFTSESPKMDFLNKIPSKYQETWKNLSESKKQLIQEQASMHNLSTQYQIDYFWETRDLREEKVSLEEQPKSLNESNLELNDDEDPYMKMISEGFKNKFGK